MSPSQVLLRFFCCTTRPAAAVPGRGASLRWMLVLDAPPAPTPPPRWGDPPEQGRGGRPFYLLPLPSALFGLTLSEPERRPVCRIPPSASRAEDGGADGGQEKPGKELAEPGANARPSCHPFPGLMAPRFPWGPGCSPAQGVGAPTPVRDPGEGRPGPRCSSGGHVLARPGLQLSHATWAQAGGADERLGLTEGAFLQRRTP